MTTQQRCEERVSRQGDYWHTYQCSREAVVERNGKWYCKVHDPQYRAQKQKVRDAKKPQCPKCHIKSQRWWAYCPYCGTKLQKGKIK